MKQDRPALAAIDLREEQPEPRWIELKGRERMRGARGLCFWEGLVCVAHEPGSRNDPPPGFVLLDPDRDFEQVGEGALPSVPHSVCSRDGELYFTMSREDSVYRATYDSYSGGWEASLYWTFPGSSGKDDENHINAIEIVDGKLCISGTGKKEEGSELWDSARRGFVYDIERSKYVMYDINHPHSLIEDSGAAWTCETRGSRILSDKGDEYSLSAGLARGLAISKDHFYVGESKKRLGSSSKGTLKDYKGACRIHRFAKGSKEPQLLIDLTEVRNEIYELMLV